MTSPSINSKSVRSQIKAFDNSRFSEAIVNQPGSLWLQVLIHFSSFETSVTQWNFFLVFIFKIVQKSKHNLQTNQNVFRGACGSDARGQCSTHEG